MTGNHHNHPLRKAAAGGYTRPAIDTNRRTRVGNTPLRVVPCPTCGAEVGEPCLTRVGTVMTSGHRDRKRAAARKYNEERGL